MIKRIIVIALIFITKSMGKLALQKGLKPITWKIYVVSAWFAAPEPRPPHPMRAIFKVSVCAACAALAAVNTAAVVTAGLAVSLRVAQPARIAAMPPAPEVAVMKFRRVTGTIREDSFSFMA